MKYLLVLTVACSFMSYSLMGQAKRIAEGAACALTVTAYGRKTYYKLGCDETYTITDNCQEGLVCQPKLTLENAYDIPYFGNSNWRHGTVDMKKKFSGICEKIFVFTID